jgi:hypothetical protein
MEVNLMLNPYDPSDDEHPPPTLASSSREVCTKPTYAKLPSPEESYVIVEQPVRERERKTTAEVNRRLDQAQFFAYLQNALLEHNEHLPEQAGWKRLHPNNIVRRIDDPLVYGKCDVLRSAITIQKQSNDIIADVIETYRGIQKALATCLHTGVSREELIDFLNQNLMGTNFETWIEESTLRRGTPSWSRPSELMQEHIGVSNF